MNKKGSQEVPSSTVGIIIAIPIFMILAFLTYLIFFKSSGEDVDISKFSYQKIVEEIKTMTNNDIKTLNFNSDKDYALIGFSKNIKELTQNDLNIDCGKVDIAGKITKPDSCQGNSCLCICETDTQLGSFGGDLIILCATEKSKCEQFKEEILGGDACNYFLYYDYNTKSQGLELTKRLDKILIKLK